MDLKYFFIVFLCALFTSSLYAQQSPQPTYKLDWRKEIPVLGSAIGLGTANYFFGQQNEVITQLEIVALNKDDIMAFDNSAISNYSIAADRGSDIFLFGSIVAPGLLMISSHASRESVTIGMMYLETLSLTAGLTAITKSLSQKVRPYAYNPDVPLDEKLRKATKNSFFSGHVSTVASMSFFSAKVFSDLHPDSKLKPYIWGAAIAAPAITGYLRYRAGKHFPTDVLVGYAVGAAVGYLVPALHKKAMNSNFSIIGAEGGIGMRYEF